MAAAAILASALLFCPEGVVLARLDGRAGPCARFGFVAASGGLGHATPMSRPAGIHRRTAQRGVAIGNLDVVWAGMRRVVTARDPLVLTASHRPIDVVSPEPL